MERILSKTNVGIILTDIILLTVIYFLPTISHLIGFPLYLLDPMRIVVLGSLLILGNKKNAYILAVTIPLFSYLFSGHPVFPKNILISVELVTNLFVFFILIKRINITFLSVFISIVVSKIIYYLIKYAIVLLGVLEMEIISTAIYIQFIVAIVLSLLFAWGYKKNRI